MLLNMKINELCVGLVDISQALIGQRQAAWVPKAVDKNFAPNFRKLLMPMFNLTTYHCSAEVKGLKPTAAGMGVQRLRVTIMQSYPSSIYSCFKKG